MRYSSSISRRKRRGRTEYIAVLSYYDEGGERRQKRRTSFSSSEAKRIARELEDEYLEGGEVGPHTPGELPSLNGLLPENRRD